MSKLPVTNDGRRERIRLLVPEIDKTRLEYSRIGKLLRKLEKEKQDLAWNIAESDPNQ